MQGTRDENWGRRAAVLAHFSFLDPQFMSRPCTSVVEGWSCLTSAMQTNLPKAAMTEEFKKNTQRQNVLAARHS